jgi:hypothetical protein
MVCVQRTFDIPRKTTFETNSHSGGVSHLERPGSRKREMLRQHAHTSWRTLPGGLRLRSQGVGQTLLRLYSIPDQATQT